MEKEDGIAYHALNIKEVLKRLETNFNGLSSEEATKRYEEYGPNELSEKKRAGAFIAFIKQFNSFFIYILLIAGIISYIADNLIDMYVIGAVIIINASIGFIQEYRAERSIRALKAMIVPYAKVYRDGQLMKIKGKELVPGDIVFLEDGDKIPADCRIIELNNLNMIESSLTGESMPVIKEISSLKKETELADRKNMIWMGSFVASGSAKAIVVQTGDNTAIGSIASDIKAIKTEKSHFQKKTDKLAIQMGLIAILGAVFIFLIGFFIRRFEFKEIIVFTMASLVSGIPEGLPAVLAIVLAIGAFKMSKKKAIIRSLPATETLAVVNIIMTDKTGTLTENVMSVNNIMLPGEKEIIVSGTGWTPIGEMIQENRNIVPLEKNGLRKLLHIAGICNNANLIKENNSEENYKIVGDPTEASLVVLIEKAGLKRSILYENEKKLSDIPFNQKLKYRASLVQNLKEKKKQIYVVGAPEIILEKAISVLKMNNVKKMTSIERESIKKQIEYLTSKARRVIGLAYKDAGGEIDNESIKGLIFAGIVGIRDPPRKEAKESIAKARAAGIRVIMATGDHKNTALAIAKELGISTDDKVLTEEELHSMNEKEFENAVNKINVFARLTPHMKFRIAESLQKMGNVIAMTGDGVNDAPALKKADVGIAMGIIGTDVAREAAKIVLADDNFSSIVNAIEEGRIVFTNTRQTSFFLITTNFAEAITLITTLVVGLPLPLLPTQILWLNLVTDSGTALGLAAEPGHDGIAEKKPENPKENILTKDIVPFLLLMSICMVGLTLGVFIYYSYFDLNKARAGAFLIMAFTQLYNSLNMRSLDKSVFKIGLFSNKYLVFFLGISVLLIVLVLYVPFLQELFKFGSLGVKEFIILFAISSSVLWLGEGYKKLKRY